MYEHTTATAHGETIYMLKLTHIASSLSTWLFHLLTCLSVRPPLPLPVLKAQSWSFVQFIHSHVIPLL